MRSDHKWPLETPPHARCELRGSQLSTWAQATRDRVFTPGRRRERFVIVSVSCEDKVRPTLACSSEVSGWRGIFFVLYESHSAFVRARLIPGKYE